jgi:ATP-binding cassette subfamily B protein
MIFFDQSPPKRRFLVPEVIQTSAMDCGPATLKCILEGFGISVSYGRLREACQTSVDGTSIDVMEDVAVQLGLDAEQVMIPADNLLVPETQTMPAIVVIRLPNGLTHFVVAWRLHSGIVQIMDPGKGRRWQSYRQFLSELYIHTHPVPMQDWREWAGTEGFCDPLSSRMIALGIGSMEVQSFIDTASQDPGWYSLAALDAAVRMTDAIVRAGGLHRGQEAARVLDAFFAKAVTSPADGHKVIPAPYWSVEPKPPEPGVDEEERLLMKGAVLVRVSGRRVATKQAMAEEKARLSPELAAALKEKSPRPELEILRFLKQDGFLTPSLLSASLAMSVFCLTIESLLFRGILDIGHSLNFFGQRIGAAAMLFVFLIGMMILEFPVSAIMQRIGRRIETRFRVAILEKIPKLSDRYFRSRLTSDMMQRIHELRGIRMFPELGIGLLRLFFQIILTVSAIIFIVPESAGIAVLSTIFSISMSFVSQPLLEEQDLRLRTHVGAMSHFYMDALLGLIPIRTHCAERSVRNEHENLLTQWILTSIDFFRVTVLIDLFEAVVQTGFTVWILFDFIGKGGSPASVLLLFYWTMSLPSLGRSLAGFAQQYPSYRNRILRLVEPLNAPEEAEILDNDPEEESLVQKEDDNGVAIHVEGVSVVAGGQTILSDVEFSIDPGEHVAIVGSSGAGKSSLVGLFLGWHKPAAGNVWIDGRRLRGRHLRTLRRQTAWVDPEVQIWNRSLFENLRYGTYDADTSPLNDIIEQADLFSVLETLPNGMQTKLGEGGGLVSGGEGQRVRLGRGMLRSGIRLAILDEPFRGLDREKRRILLKRAREHWKDATLIFISHDVGEALTFERVLVIEKGQLIEDDSPSCLAEQPDSRYRALIDSEEAVRKTLWESAEWRHLWLENGTISEKQNEPPQYPDSV